MNNAKVNQIIGQNLRTHRKAAHMTQLSIAKHVGVSGALISKIENGITAVTPYQLYRVGELLDVRISKLLEGVGK